MAVFQLFILVMAHVKIFHLAPLDIRFILFEVIFAESMISLFITDRDAFKFIFFSKLW
jgi:hypothetical protein